MRREEAILSAVAEPTTHTSASAATARWEVWAERLFGPRSEAADGHPLTLRSLAAIVAFLVVWRLSILGLSILWGRVGIVTPWPADIDVMWLWRYSVRWDSGWYLGVVRDGYIYYPGLSSSVAFFPLFPKSINVLDWLLPGGDVFAGLLIVHLALAAACVYVYQMVRLDFGERVAWRTLFFVLIFPSAFFLSALYAESLLLLGLAGSLYHARRGQWVRAGLFGAVASATKIVGLMMPLPLLIEILHQRQLNPRRPYPLLAPLLAPLGGLAYFLYLHLQFGSWHVFFDVEGSWRRDTGQPIFFMGVERLLGDMSALVYYPATSTPLRTIFLIWDTSLLWIFLAAGIYLWFRVRPSYAALVIPFALVPAFSGNPQSLNRYLGVLFPAFILLGKLEREWLRSALTIAFTMGLAFTTYLFVNGYWAG